MIEPTVVVSVVVVVAVTVTVVMVVAVAVVVVVVIVVAVAVLVVTVVVVVVADGATIVSEGPVVTAPLDKILPFILTVVPTVIAALLSTFPAKTLFAPSVVAPTGTQNTLPAFAFPASKTFEPAAVLSAPPSLKR